VNLACPVECSLLVCCTIPDEQCLTVFSSFTLLHYSNGVNFVKKGRPAWEFKEGRMGLQAGHLSGIFD
jgi:hypothetical protein